jgi:hypothetical protein
MGVGVSNDENCYVFRLPIDRQHVKIKSEHNHDIGSFNGALSCGM